MQDRTPPFEIAVDVGGTFTDLVLRDSEGRTSLFKSLTTPDDLSKGIINGLELIAARLGLGLRELLGMCRGFAAGTTAATNAILEGKTARTALLCTDGFRDVLSIREGGRRNGIRLDEHFPDPYIPRGLTFGIRERVNAEGGIELALDERQTRQAVAALEEARPQAIAVAFLWSVLNPVHELRVAEILRETLPDVPVSLSHRVSPAVGEYRRTSATAIDASLKPVLRRQISDLEAVLRNNGFEGQPTFVCSNGGRTSSREITEKPVHLCLSGPSTAPQAAIRLARAAGLPHGDIITIDLGGTSLDASIAKDGQVAMHREGSIAGHVFGVASVDVITVGAGGGSIARVDEGGLVHVGPRSAGAFPGPACYGRGGREPTLTDANLVRGLLDPERFADGQFALSRAAAEEALGSRIATPLGISVEAAASLVSLVAEQSMVAAIEDLAMRRGCDPREFALVSGGAAGGLHAVSLAKELGIQNVLIPHASSVLCAYGTATGDTKFDFSRTLFTTSRGFVVKAVNSLLADLFVEGSAFLESMGVADEQRRYRFSVDARYQGQVSQINLPVPSRSIEAEAVPALVDAFHDAHDAMYAVRAPNDTVEFVSWSLEAIGESTSVPAIKTVAPRRAVPSRGCRRANVGRDGSAVDLALFDADEVRAGNVLDGPCLLEGRLTSVFVPEGASGVVTAEGGLLVTISVAEGGDAWAGPVSHAA